jgi:homoserine dehydrogenase
MTRQRAVLGLIGWGVVGGGVIDLIQRETELFAERCGLDLVLKAVVDRRPGKDRAGQPGATLPVGCAVGTDPALILSLIHI